MNEENGMIFHHCNVTFDSSIYLINEPGIWEAGTIRETAGNTDIDSKRVMRKYYTAACPTTLLGYFIPLNSLNY
jgi:hypothetical protein